MKDRTRYTVVTLALIASLLALTGADVEARSRDSGGRADAGAGPSATFRGMDMPERGRPTELARRPEPPLPVPLPADIGVSVEQAAGQLDPVMMVPPPIEFDVVFEEAILPSTFTTMDIDNVGTATVDAWDIDNTGDDMNFELRATTVSSPGTVIPTIPAGSVETAGGLINADSTSIDNSVSVLPAGPDSDTFLYVATWNPPKIYSYAVDTGDGSLTEAGDPVMAAEDVRDLEVTPDNACLYFAGSHLTRYLISSDGSITQSASVATSMGSLDDIEINADGSRLYGSHSNGKLHVYRITGATPALIDQQNGLSTPHGVALNPVDDYAYVANGFGFLDPPGAEEIATYEIFGNGTVDAPDFTDFFADADYFAIHPSGDYLYYTERPPGGVVRSSEITANGATVESPFDMDFAGDGHGRLAINPAGTRVYVTNHLSHDVTVFRVTLGGGLTRVMSPSTFDVGPYPEDILLHGDTLYVLGFGNSTDESTISVFSVDVGGSPELTLVETITIPQTGAYRLAIAEIP